MKLKSNETIVLKNKIINILMKNGKKRTGEKILLKSAKLLQKSTSKSFQNLVQLVIINTTPVFKLNEQAVKKGKRKAQKIIPFFIVKNSLRIMTALKFLKDSVAKDKTNVGFHKSLVKEILAASSLKGQSIEQKNKLQTQALLNKRYMSKFRW
nr:ribosomal protein S7 [Nitzschia ovalis]